jgi:hypothetical protein
VRQDFAGNNAEDSGIWLRFLRVPLERGAHEGAARRVHQG